MSHPAREPVLMAGAFLAPGVEVHDDVLLEPGAVVLAPSEGLESKTVLESGVVVGANATVLPGIRIGTRARVSPGSVVNRSVPPLAVVDGNPARIVGYEQAEAAQAEPMSAGEGTTGRPSRVKGVLLQPFPLVRDLRGNLIAAEFERELPFKPERLFMVFEVPSVETRGAHAHRTCAQMLICVRGSVRVAVDDGTEREELLLDRPTLGLFIPSMIWAVQYAYSADALLLVLASEPYNADEYIRDYSEYITEKHSWVPSR